MTAEVTAWLAANAVPLDSLTAGSPTGDLEPLKRTLDGVRVVGLGEATHGTREFFLLKHRLLEFLVTEMGFSVLAMEASASAGLAVDQYVLHGTGEAADVLARLGFWTWRTYEVLAMIEWMRAYNRGVPDDKPDDKKVRFVGIDPQRCGDSITVLDAFLRAAAPERAAAFRAGLGGLADATPGAPLAARRQWLRDTQELVGYLERDAAELTELTSATRVDEARRHARLVVRAADVVSRPPHHEAPERSALVARDRYMAEAVAELLDRDDAAKVALWAHNGHIMTGHYGGGVPAAGRHLRQRYGEAYYGLGLLFGKGAFRACRGGRRALARPASAPRRPVRNTIGAAGSDFVEAKLSEASAGSHMVNLRTDGDAPPTVEQWLRESHSQRSFGAYVPRFVYRLSSMPTVLAEEYDGLVFIPESTCSRPLPPLPGKASPA